MKKVLIALIVGALFSCSSKLQEAETELTGCWQLATVDGEEKPEIIHFVKYNESKSYTYWGTRTNEMLLIDSTEIRYNLNLDSNENLLLSVFLEKDSSISQISIKDKTILECKVLKSTNTWAYKKVPQEKLDSIVSLVKDQKQF